MTTDNILKEMEKMGGNIEKPSDKIKRNLNHIDALESLKRISDKRSQRQATGEDRTG